MAILIRRFVLLSSLTLSLHRVGLLVSYRRGPLIVRSNNVELLPSVTPLENILSLSSCRARWVVFPFLIRNVILSAERAKLLLVNSAPMDTLLRRMAGTVHSYMSWKTLEKWKKLRLLY